MIPAQDLTGQRVGMLMVVGPGTRKYSRNETAWVCRCDCGTTKEMLGRSLRRGEVKSCGCQRWKPQNERAQNMVGTQHGLLTVIALDGIVNRRPAYRCRCECGNELSTDRQRLMRGLAHCGCKYKRRRKTKQ
jgi:hypothetical protein